MTRIRRAYDRLAILGVLFLAFVAGVVAGLQISEAARAWDDRSEFRSTPEARP